MLKLELTTKFSSHSIPSPLKSIENSSMRLEKPSSLPFLSKLPASKRIKKDKIATCEKDCKSVVFINKDK